MGIYGELIDEIDYADSELPKHLRKDNWTLTEGWLLLTDLSPDDSSIAAPYTFGIEVRFVRPLTAGKLFTLIYEEDKMIFTTNEEIASSLSSKLGKDISEEQILETIDIIKKAQESYERKFLDLREIWYSGDHGEYNFHPVQYYIQWAEEKKIPVPWLDWAKNKGLLQNVSSKEKPLGERAKTTYHNIIGALLEFIAGESPETEKHPNFESEAKLIEKFSDYNVSGLSKSTLENKFAEAKRSFKSETNFNSETN